MIKKEMTIKEILELNTELISIFNSYGLRGFDNPLILNKVGVNSLESVLKMKNINIDEFVRLLNEKNSEEVSDVTLKERSSNVDNLKIFGLLPCPVRVPLMEIIDERFTNKGFDFELKAASEGLDWLKDSVREAKSEDELADMYLSAGFDLFFEDGLINKFRKQGVFKDITNMEINKDFNNDEISLKDPNGDYSMIAVVAAVFVVNKKELGDRPMPKSWSDLFDPIYENSISLPVSDFDLFNSILLHLYKFYGMDKVEQLGKALYKSMHPAEMIKSANKVNRPAISIMPYFFTKMAVPGGIMEAVWPEDGAIISPIFMLTKKKKENELKELANTFASKEVGEILSSRGLFPSLNAEVDNNLSGKKFKWVGWDFINENNIGELIKELMQKFNESRGVK